MTSASPNPSTPSDVNRKRARPTKSCLECRRKKLKCDRIQPCMQCKKMGRETLCQFASGPTGSNEAEEDWERNGNKHPRVEVSKIASWGSRIGSGLMDNGFQGKNGGALENTYGGLLGIQDTPKDTVSTPLGKIQVYGNGTYSKYVGLVDRMALLDHFEAEKSFIKSSFKDPDLSGTMKELMLFQGAFSHKTGQPRHYHQNRDSILMEMMNALPEDSVIDLLTGRFVSNMENILRVLHFPTFLKQCQTIKTARGTQTALPADFPEAALPQLLNVISITSRLSDTNEPKSVQLPPEQLTGYSELTKRWLEGLKGKQRLTLHALRTEALVLVARKLNMESNSKIWRDSGSLVRMAMIMGLHRDPEDIIEMSIFEKTQRRKLWQTIVELDLQFSLAAGLPPAIQSSDFDPVNGLENVDDQDLTEEMTNYPVSHPSNQYTDSLPQIILAKSMKKRLDIANVLSRNVNLERDSGQFIALAKNLEAEVHFHLQNVLPQRTRRHTLFASLMLDVFIRRFSLALYRTVAMSEQGSRYLEARRGALRSSVAILSHLDALDPTVADLGDIKSKDFLNLFHLICKDDIAQSSLLVCYEIRSFNSPDREVGIGILNDSAPWTKHSLTRIVENTLNSHLQRLGEFGTDLKTILPLSIVLQSVRSDGTPEGKREMMIRGTERVLFACRKAKPDLQISPEITAAPGGSGCQQEQENSAPPMKGWNPAVLMMPPKDQDFNILQHQPLSPWHHLDQISSGNFESQDFDFGFSDCDIGQSWY